MYVGTISNKERSFDIVFGYSHYDYGGSKKIFNKNTVSCGFDTECQQVLSPHFYGRAVWLWVLWLTSFRRIHFLLFISSSDTRDTGSYEHIEYRHSVHVDQCF
jgi:hypothetical protein